MPARICGRGRQVGLQVPGRRGWACLRASVPRPAVTWRAGPRGESAWGAPNSGTQPPGLLVSVSEHRPRGASGAKRGLPVVAPGPWLFHRRAAQGRLLPWGLREGPATRRLRTAYGIWPAPWHPPTLLFGGRVFGPESPGPAPVCRAQDSALKVSVNVFLLRPSWALALGK